jgi:nitrogen-specific signal transduction histidine kinase
MANTSVEAYAEKPLTQERKILALEAMSKLADQFARDPQLQSLIDSVVLTVAGQFGVTSAMIVTRSDNLHTKGVIHSATGQFRGLNPSTDYLLPASQLADPLATHKALRLDDLRVRGEDDLTLLEWRECGVQVFVPLVINGSAIGILLIGPRVGGMQFSEDDFDLLQHLMAVITPLLANSLLYADMTALSERHRQILDSVRQAILVFDCDGVLRMANRTARDLMHSMIGGDGSELRIGITIESVFPSQTFPGWAERLKCPRFEQISRFPITMTAKGQDGERVFGVSLTSRIGLSSSTDGCIMTLDDKTEQTNNERRMFDLEKFAEQGVMASSISHELNNHLGLILGGVDLALVALEKGNQLKVTSTLAKVRESVLRMERFTAGLMDFARVTPQKQASHINEVVSDVVSFALAQKRFSAVALNTNLTPNLPALQMDRDQIAQIIINILNNAADAISETGRRDGVIIVSTAVKDKEMILSVSDNGRGMTREVKEKLFKTHLTTKPKGHGYGLTTCAKILDHHGAKISIDSNIGFGTTFEFTFPISD